MKHFYSDFFFCKNNFFENPDKVVEFAESLDYTFTHKSFPGIRTENLSLIKTKECVEFSNMFAQKLVNEVYTNIVNMNIDIRFHKYPILSDDKNDLVNFGWVHQDHEVIAGVLYLNKIDNFDCGTSLYNANTRDVIPPHSIREEFNVNQLNVNKESYISEMQKYNSQFSETLKAGNLYNRLVTYDSKLYHRPNNCFLGNNEFRLTLLFVISEYECRPRQFNVIE